MTCPCCTSWSISLRTIFAVDTSLGCRSRYYWRRQKSKYPHLCRPSSIHQPALRTDETSHHGGGHRDITDQSKIPPLFSRLSGPELRNLETDSSYCLIQGVDAGPDGIQLISDIIREKLQIDVSVLMGANIASEVADDKFCETTIGWLLLNQHVWQCDFGFVEIWTNCISHRSEKRDERLHL